MIEVKNLETGLKFTDYVQGIMPNVPVWVSCTDPTREELQSIHTTFLIPWEDLEDSVDEDERPRTELDLDDPTFIKLVVRVPILQNIMSETRDLNVTQPAVIFLTGDHLVTIQSESFSTKRIRKPIGSRRKRSTPTILVLLDWLESVVKSFELVVDKIDRDLAKVERVIFKSVKSKSIERVFRLSRDTTYLDAALKGNLRAFYRLEQAPLFAQEPELKDDLEDLSIDLQQQAELLRIYRDLIESSLDAYGSVISNNLNDLIKVLTSISLILMIPTLIASIYGMNLGPEFGSLPLADSPFAFWIILIISAVLIVPIWIILRKIDML